MKRLLALVLAIVMVAAFAVGCTSKKGGKDDNKVLSINDVEKTVADTITAIPKEELKVGSFSYMTRTLPTTKTLWMLLLQ